jgi:hypothetical protein
MDVFDEPQFDKTAWAAQKKAQREAVFAAIDCYLEELSLEPERLRDYLTVQARFPLCSVGNALLLAAQRPEVTEYRTFEGWKQQGVAIGKGQQAISMLVPSGTYPGKDGKTHTRCDVQKVFDVAQTNAVRAPQVQDLRGVLKAMLLRPVCPVQVSDQQKGAAYVAQENRVEIGRGMTLEDTMQQLSLALAHGELAKTDVGNPRNGFYARCVSFMVCRRYGLDPQGYSFLDMQSVLGNCNSKELRQHLTVIQATARNLIDRVEKARSALEQQEKSPEREAR